MAALAALAGVGIWEMWGTQSKDWVRRVSRDAQLDKMLTAPAEADAAVEAPATKEASPASAAELPGLELVSDPSGAEVVFDGRSLGRTPLTVRPNATSDALMDQRRYSLKLEGYEVVDLSLRTEPLPTGPVVVGAAVLEPVAKPAGAAIADPAAGQPSPTPVAARVPVRRVARPRTKVRSRAAPRPAATTRVAKTTVAKPKPKPPPPPKKDTVEAAEAEPTKIALPAKKAAARAPAAPKAEAKPTAKKAAGAKAKEAPPKRAAKAAVAADTKGGGDGGMDE